MYKGNPNPRYTVEFKQMVIETIYKEHLSYHEIAKRFGMQSLAVVRNRAEFYLLRNLINPARAFR